MLTAYETRLITSYLANIASGLTSRDPEAQALIDWVGDGDHRIGSGAGETGSPPPPPAGS